METVGPYELLERLGAGGMGEVWAARHRDHGWEVALKRVPDTGATGWADPLAEVRAVAAMDHPHIVRVLDLARGDGFVWIAMERARGSLADGLPADWAGARVVLESVLRALAHAHARGVVHLDVKPENVLRHERGRGVRWTLADFGLAHLAGVLRPGDDRPRGTPAFMAPEQYTARTELWGPATDLYAAGCLLTLLLTGQPPFPEDDVGALARAHRFREPPPIHPRFPVPDALEGWRLRLLEKDPADRYPRVADALYDLDALTLSDGQDPAPPEAWRADTFSFDALDGLQGARPEPTSAPVLPAEPAAPLTDAHARLVASPALLDLRAIPLVGRAALQARVRAALEEVRETGGPRQLYLVGPPGIGRRAVARACCWSADESGAARFLRPGEAASALDRPGITWHVLGDREAELEIDRWVDAALPILVLGCAAEQDPLPAGAEALVVGPLADVEAAHLLRNLAPLAETLVAELVRTSGGHPGQLVARVRAWAESDRLLPGPYGLTLAPVDGADPDAWLDGVDPADPFLPLAWSVSADPEAALDDLVEAVERAGHAGQPGRALWLLALVDRALDRLGVPALDLRLRAANLRTVTLNAMGQMEQAGAACLEATELARELGDPERLATALAQQAHITRFLGADPIPLLEEAETLSSDPGTIARARATRGSVWIVREELERARELLESAATLLASNGIDRFLGTTLFWLGNTWLYAGEHARAREVHQRSLEAFERVGSAAGRSMAAASLTQEALLADDLEGAERALAVVEEASAASESPWMRSNAMSLRGWFLERTGRLEEAESLQRRALDLLEDTNLPRSNTRIRLARVLLRLERVAEAATLVTAVDGDDCGPTAQVELHALRVASLAPSDPAWSDALEACRRFRSTRPEVQTVLGIARSRLDGDPSGAVEALLDDTDS